MNHTSAARVVQLKSASPAMTPVNPPSAEVDRLSGGSDRDLDYQLVLRAQRGDKLAFELLVSKYQRKLARLVGRLVRDPGEAEDVTQETFIKAYRALGNFRGDSAFIPGCIVSESTRQKIFS